MLRSSIPHSSQQRPLLSSLHRVLDVTAVEAFALSELRQEGGSIIQREVDLLICQQAGKELVAGDPVRKCHCHPLLEATENLWIDLIGIARCTKEKDVTVAVLRSLSWANCPMISLLRASVALATFRLGAIISRRSRNTIAGEVARARSKKSFTRLPLWPE